MLAEYARSRGVRRHEGRIAEVVRNGEDGMLRAVRLASGQAIEADFFIDCTGFRALLIGDALGVGYRDWSRWLPCDRAFAVASRRVEAFPSYTRATARPAGWQWRIPLQHRFGNGHVYASRFMADDAAEALLLASLEGEAIGAPRPLRFRPGQRERAWSHNCVAVGLAAGFLEPLESTGLHLIQSAILRLVRLMPDADFDPATIAEYNRQTDYEYERVRDFIILHYKATRRDDTPFWRYVRDMDIPDTLRRKWDLFAANGRIFREDDELFAEESWIQVFLGQGVTPRRHDPLVDVTDTARVAAYVANIEAVNDACVRAMPDHAGFIARHCAAAPQPAG